MDETRPSPSLPKAPPEGGSGPAHARGVSLPETPSRLGAVSIAAVYAAGFLIITLHGSQFGIVDFSPFRPRIFSAGALFALLVAVPLLAVSRIFEFFGLRNPMGVAIQVRPENVKYLKLSVEFSFYFVCTWLCYLSVMLFPPEEFAVKPWGFTLFITAAVFFALGTVAQRGRFDSHPFTSAILTFLSATGLVLVVFLFWDRSFFWLSMWYYFVAIATVYLHDVFESPEKTKGLEWEKAILFCLGAVLAFSSVIYGRISPSFGGGSPRPAVLHLVTKAPISSAMSVPVLLVDENDFGYYVLKPGELGTAYFLRRDLVSSIEFAKR